MRKSVLEQLLKFQNNEKINILNKLSQMYEVEVEEDNVDMVHEEDTELKKEFNEISDHKSQSNP